MDKNFKYSFFYRLIYKYGNIPVTFLLLFYAVPIVITFKFHYKYILPALVVFAGLILINKYFLSHAKQLPYLIKSDETKITASKYLFSHKKVTINYDEIDKLSGGIFEGKHRGLMKIENTKEKKVIAFFHTLENARVLETLILSKVSKELYDSVINRFSENKERVKKQLEKSKK